MSLEKLTIFHEEGTEGRYTGSIRALFNPRELSFSKNVTWSQEAVLYTRQYVESWWTSFRSSSPEILTIQLFFDVYEEAGRLKGSLLRYFQSSPSVFSHTQKLMKLARLQEELHRPPICMLQWGKRTLFTGVLTHISQRVTLFLEDGTPVRATVDCTFQEIASDSDAIRDELHSPDVEKTYVVRPGDTLNRIAAELYEDASRWRVIAEANGIDNPRVLSPGQVLIIPKLT